MRFLVDSKNKVILGWSPKCGCSHIKYIFWFLQNNKINNQIHTDKDTNKLPKNIEQYTTIIISRNPLKRLVSGFLDKYKIDGEYRHLWNNDIITFNMFIQELTKTNWQKIDHHHFSPQTAEDYDPKILQSKIIKCFDIENIDYEFIEKLYNKKIPTIILQKKLGHERKKNYENTVDNYVYDLDMKQYYAYNVETKYFYNEELKKLVKEFYDADYRLFSYLGIDYLSMVL
uniref:Sulfotransferase domain-containing protein n=1 Tax=viral metagenome TaxID=1070528 RepID=A0A6C0DZA4_9ZZZZ